SVFMFVSPGFDSGQEVFQEFGKKIQNPSPPLEWDEVPEGTRSFALEFVDIHPVATDFVHWLVADIGPQISSIPEGAAGGASFGFTEINPYQGPFPPSGTHDYQFTLYALRTDSLDVRPGAKLQEFRKAAEQNLLSKTALIGKFTKIK